MRPGRRPRHDAVVQPDEELFLRTFIDRKKRQRWLDLMSSPKSRRKITQRLYDGPPGDFDPTQIEELEHTNADALVAKLTAMGAGTKCWIIAADDNVDWTEEPLREAVEATYGGWREGVVLICVPDRLAYVEAELGRFILRAS